MFSLDDTIAAIATPPGQGGIGVVRLSGPDAPAIALQCFQPASFKHNWQPEVRRMYLGHFIDPANRRRIDEVLLCYMPSPHSYTCQDVVEIQAHGGAMPLRRIIALCLRLGARMAGPGEFTLRAFINGRIDLVQAEAVQDAIRAETEAALHVAQRQMEGRLSGQLQALRRDLLQVLAYLQARTDFPEDDVPARDLHPDLERISLSVAELLTQADQGMLFRQGVRTAIIGRPNVGKSRLLNCMVGTERAIVTEIPGTTRDTLNETINLDGIPLDLVDTAGIGQTDNPVELLGIERSRKAVAQSDLVLLVVDASQQLSPADNEVAALIDGKRVLLVLNKSDLSPLHSYDELLPAAPRVSISALTGAGLPELRASLVTMILGGAAASQEALVSNPRHQAALAGVQEHITAAQRGIEQGIYEDLLAIDLGEAVRLLGELTGESASEELLTAIFSTFCIGK